MSFQLPRLYFRPESRPNGQQSCESLDEALAEVDGPLTSPALSPRPTSRTPGQLSWLESGEEPGPLEQLPAHEAATGHTGSHTAVRYERHWRRRRLMSLAVLAAVAVGLWTLVSLSDSSPSHRFRRAHFATVWAPTKAAPAALDKKTPVSKRGEIAQLRSTTSTKGSGTRIAATRERPRTVASRTTTKRTRRPQRQRRKSRLSRRQLSDIDSLLDNL